MNVEMGTDAAQFPEKEYIIGIFLAVLYMRAAQQSSIVSSTVQLAYTFLRVFQRWRLIIC
jgi:hypothetical protein